MGLPFLSQRLRIPLRRKIFVSYHHVGDQWYYNQLSEIFAESYETIYDNSVDRLIDSDNVDYVIRNIRENFITGSSCTIVLCGAQTSWRKYVDWEIKATLDKQHGLIGVNLPSNPMNPNGTFTVPDRLYDNIISGYAVWIKWLDLTKGPAYLSTQIEIASARSKKLIDNSRPMRERNG